MRKLLLATVAMLGASMGLAYAASESPMTPEASQATPTPTPGNIVIHLNGRVNTYFGIVGDYNAYSNGGNKVQNTGGGTYARLFPGFDGIAANGLKYGAAMEIRNDPGVGTSNNARGTLYWQRQYVYLGTDQIGTFRFGSADGPASLFLTGTMESFNDGGWDGDAPGLFTGVNVPLWPAFGDYGGIYNTTKLVYLSPQFAGFDFGLGYEPNTGGGSLNSECPGGVAGVGCDRLSSTTDTASLGRRRNTVDVAVRYRGTFGAVGLAAYANYLGGGRVGDANDAVTGPNTPGTYTTYKDLSAGAGGAQVTFGGFSVGGWVGGGQINLPTGLEPSGGKSSIAYIAGAQYVTGPLTVGFHWFDSWFAGHYGFQSDGSFVNSGENDYGVAAGGTYALVPGVSVYLSYLYGKRKQNGYDFINAVGGTGNNVVQSQGLVIGTQFNW